MREREKEEKRVRVGLQEMESVCVRACAIVCVRER